MITTELRLALVGAIETALNRYLQMDPDSRHQLSRMAGKCLALELTGLALTLYLLVDEQGIQVFSDYAGKIDATLSGTPMELLNLALEKTPGPAMFAGGAKITGDTELGQAFKRLFDRLDIDWEEHLSRYTGDIVAYKIGNLFRSGLQWGTQASQTFRQDIAEYLLEEEHLVPSKQEMERFFSDIDLLREDSDRLQARLQKLQNQLSTSEI